MGPSLAVREPRRSSRRPTSTPATRSSLSPPRASVPAALPSPHTPTTPVLIQPTFTHKRSNSGLKRVKLEPEDSRSPMDDATIPAPNGRTKRRPKDKLEVILPPPIAPGPSPQDVFIPDPQDDNDDDGGITRCVCGRIETDGEEDELGFMVQCETCKVWQHGVCVNLRQEDANDQDYYCEQCRPDLHVDLLKNLKKRVRHPANHPQPNARRHSASVPRSSRSHSPGHILAAASAVVTKAPKRRNTMNSRDAAYEDALKELIESTRPDAEKDPDAQTDRDDHAQPEEPGIIIEIVSGARKKRKRTTVDKENANAVNAEIVNIPTAPKQNRSNSSTPDRPIASTLAQRDITVNGTTTTTNGTGVPPRHTSTSSGIGAKSSAAVSSSKAKRGRKDATASIDTMDAASSKKHPNQYTYRKPAAPNGTANASVHDHGTRRNAHAPHMHTPAVPQPLFTSWGLPDYLAHLASALPSDVPRPVEVRALKMPEGEGEAPVEERVPERGVKVKWPAKRTSVGDMNKRVRGIIDWVGREQAVAVERQRRREALQKGCESQLQRVQAQHGGNAEKLDSHMEEPPGLVTDARIGTGTTHLMEELMKELIAFQEKFGPGAKGKEQRDRRGVGG